MYEGSASAYLPVIHFRCCLLKRNRGCRKMQMAPSLQKDTNGPVSFRKIQMAPSLQKDTNGPVSFRKIQMAPSLVERYKLPHIFFFKNASQVRDNTPLSGVRHMRDVIPHLPDPTQGGIISHLRRVFEETEMRQFVFFYKRRGHLYRSTRDGPFVSFYKRWGHLYLSTRDGAICIFLQPRFLLRRQKRKCITGRYADFDPSYIQNSEIRIQNRAHNSEL